MMDNELFCSIGCTHFPRISFVVMPAACASPEATRDSGAVEILAQRFLKKMALVACLNQLNPSAHGHHL